MKFRLLVWFYCVAMFAVVAIGNTSSAETGDEVADSAPLFYPSPPSRPRLQFLTKFSSSLDVSSKKQGFRNFVFGGEENEAHLVRKPYGVAIHDGAIFVTDSRGNGYGIFDVANGKSQFVRPSGAGAIKKAIAITIDSDGTRFVTDTVRNQVLVFDSNDNFVKAYGESDQFRPADVAIIGDRLYISDNKHHQIAVLDKASGELLFSFAEPGSEEGQLFQPTNLTVGPHNTLYVVDTGNFRLQEFEADGKFIRAIGGVGTSPGRFARPKGIALDRENRIYAVDAAFGRIQILDPEGMMLMLFGSRGDSRDGVTLPTVVRVDYESIQHFQKYAAPGFEIEYLVVVASQFGPNKVVVYGFGSFDE
jgi:DNA-binding beta-propeller fold protein YncE